MKNKFLLLGVLIIVVFGSYVIFQKHNTNQALAERKDQCLSWSHYDSEIKMWRWKDVDIKEYFPTRDEAVDNCLAVYKEVFDI